jgi:hypothetical protein
VSAKDRPVSLKGSTIGPQSLARLPDLIGVLWPADCDIAPHSGCLPTTACGRGVPQQSKKSIGDGLEFAALAPVFIGSSFRAAFLEPKEVGTFAKVLVESVMPMFFRSPMRMAVLLPNVIGAHTKDILQTLHCAFQDMSIIPVRSQRSTPSNMQSCREGLDIAIGKER